MIEAAGVAGMDVESMLDDLIAAQVTDRATGLADAITDWAGLRGWPTSEAFARWKDRTHVVGRWLFSEDVHEYLLGRFEAQPNHVDAAKWAEACDIIDALTGTSSSSP